MNKSKEISGKCRRTRLVLTGIEKLDATHSGLAFAVKAWFDQGLNSEAITKLVLEKFGASVTASMVDNYRARRWVREKERMALKMVAAKSAIDNFGGDAGLDAVLLAKLWELMEQLTVPQLLSARALFVKVRSQNLKEQEFLLRTGQLKPGQTEDDQLTQQRKVLQRVKEIFGLDSGEEAELELEPKPEAKPEAEQEQAELPEISNKQGA
jgi:hypothetical protein